MTKKNNYNKHWEEVRNNNIIVIIQSINWYENEHFYTSVLIFISL